MRAQQPEPPMAVRLAAWGLAALTLAVPLAAAGQRGGERPAVGKFLVASRELHDSNFRETVVLIVDYGAHEGTIGLVINRPSGVDLPAALPELRGLEGREEPIFIGGPVEPLQIVVLVRSDAEPERARSVFADVHFSSSRELLERLSDEPRAGETFRVYAGYAGWAPGQLEVEIALGGWHVLPGEVGAIFDQPSKGVWPKLILRGSAQRASLEPARRDVLTAHRAP